LTYDYSDQYGCSNSSALVMYATECTGLEKTSASAMQVFPNPARDFVSISGLADGMLVRVNDMSGRQLQSLVPVAGESKVDLSGYGSGLYLISVTSPEGQVLTTKRIVKE
jgi:hypothetical protein